VKDSLVAEQESQAVPCALHVRATTIYIVLQRNISLGWEGQHHVLPACSPSMTEMNILFVFWFSK
jgi:hypothetical protein